MDNPIAQMAMLDADRLLVGSWDGYLRVYDTSNQTCEHSMMVFQRSGVRCVAATKINDYWFLYAGTEDCCISAWKISEGSSERVHQWKAHRSEVTSLHVACIEKKTLLFSGGEDGTVKSWQPMDGGGYDEFLAHDGAILAFVMTPHLIYCCSQDKTIRSFETRQIQDRVRERVAMGRADLQSHQVSLYEKLSNKTNSKPKKREEDKYFPGPSDFYRFRRLSA